LALSILDLRRPKDLQDGPSDLTIAVVADLDRCAIPAADLVQAGLLPARARDFIQKMAAVTAWEPSVVAFRNRNSATLAVALM
jgi:hypothetical protein